MQPEPPLTDEEFAMRADLFEDIFRGLSADMVKKASLDEREQNSLSEFQHLTYGEVDLQTLRWLLDLVKEKHGPLYAGQGVFLDLGSGAGKACLGAGLLHSFEKVVGMEQLECLAGFANAALEKYRDGATPEGAPRPEADLRKGDFVAERAAQLDALAEQVAVCLAVATCFGDEQLRCLAALSEKMPAGAVFIMFTQVLPDAENNGWSLVHTELMQMIWGEATCFIYKKGGGDRGLDFEGTLEVSCSKCGNEYMDDAMFCRKCGNPRAKV